VCAYPSHSWTPCQHRVGQCHFGCGFAMPLFSSFHCSPPQTLLTLLQLWHLQRASSSNPSPSSNFTPHMTCMALLQATQAVVTAMSCHWQSSPMASHWPVTSTSSIRNTVGLHELSSSSNSLNFGGVGCSMPALNIRWHLGSNILNLSSTLIVLRSGQVEQSPLQWKHLPLGGLSSLSVSTMVALSSSTSLSSPEASSLLPP